METTEKSILMPTAVRVFSSERYKSEMMPAMLRVVNMASDIAFARKLEGKTSAHTTYVSGENPVAKEVTTPKTPTMARAGESIITARAAMRNAVIRPMAPITSMGLRPYRSKKKEATKSASTCPTAGGKGGESVAPVAWPV